MCRMLCSIRRRSDTSRLTPSTPITCPDALRIGAARKLRALVESGQTSTVLFELGSGVVVQARKLGLIEKIDWAAVAPAAISRARADLPISFSTHAAMRCCLK